MSRRRTRERVGFDPKTREVDKPTRAELSSARGSGSTLSPSTRKGFERRLGADLSQVRIHTDQRADRLSRQLNAEAFTVKNDVFFTGGAVKQGLLKHELTHVAQQQRSTSSAGATSGPLKVSSPHDAAEQRASASANANTVYRTEKESLKVVTDAMIAQYVEGFDVAFGRWIADHALAAQGGEFLLNGIHKVLKLEFSRSGGGDEAKFLIKALGPPAELRQMPGAPVIIKIDDIKAVAAKTGPGSLRTKMSLAYMAIRCGVLTRGMQSARAASQSHASGKDQKTRDKTVASQWGLDAAALRAVNTGDPKNPDLRQYFTRQQRVEHQQRSAREGEGTGMAAQEQRTIGESEFVGITLSYDELKAVANGDKKARDAATKAGADFDSLDEDAKRKYMIKEYADVKLPEYTPGFAVYRVDKRSQEAQIAGSQTKLVGGLSGSTDMYLHLAKYLGASKTQMQLVRLAAFGEMLPRRDHSFYEVVVAGQGYGLNDIDPNKGVAAYAKIPPLTSKDVADGTGMILPSQYKKGATGKSAQKTLKEDLHDVQGSAEAYAKEFEATKGNIAASATARWHDFWRATGYKWAHDDRVKKALDRINAAQGVSAGVSVMLTDQKQKDAALEILRLVQRYSENPTRVVPEVHASKAFKQLDQMIGAIPANQVLAVYVKQYVGPEGLITPSTQFAMELEAIESGKKPLPPVSDMEGKAQDYYNQIWPEAQAALHKGVQAAELKCQAEIAALDSKSPTFEAEKQRILAEWRRTTTSTAAETWKRVQAQIEAVEKLDPIERYAIYTYTQGKFYGDLNAALMNEQKLTKKERAVGLAAASGLRKLPVYPGPVYRAQRTGQGLRRGITDKKLDDAENEWKVGMVTKRNDFLSTFKGPKEPIEFMQSQNGEHYDLLVTIDKVTTGRWTLVLSAAEAVASAENPEHGGEVTFPPGSRFRVKKPLNTKKARAKNADPKTVYCETTWEEITPPQAAPQGSALPTVGDDKLPDQYKPQPAAAVVKAQPPKGGPPPPPPTNNPKRQQIVQQAPDDLKAPVAVIMQPPKPARLVKGKADEKLPDPPKDLIIELLGKGL